MDINEFLESSFDEPSVHRSGQADLEALTRAWINERGAPEILPWPQDGLIERTIAAIKAQIEKVEILTGDMDPKTNFSLIIIQTELERWKYLIRSFLRARIAKLDEHALYYLKNEDMRTRLTEVEIAYAERKQGLLQEHYLGSFLNAFPENLRGMQDTAGGISMVTAPDADAGVFVRGVGGRPGNEGSERGSTLVRVRGREEDGEAEIKRGAIVVARWADVKEHVENGELEMV